MRATSILAEAGSNLTTGTSRALLWATAFVALIGAVSVLDTRAYVDVLQHAEKFRASGASVQVVDSPESIDGTRCAALATVAGINAAGALRPAEPIRARSLPSTDLSVWEMTPELPEVLKSIGSALDGSAGPGVWLSEDLAAMLGTSAGQVLTTSVGDARIGGVYTWPDDGRERTLGFAVLVPVPALGAFDQCWLEIWPTDAQRRGLTLTASAAGSADPSVSQLNSTLGAEVDVVELIETRPTRPAPIAAAVLGIGLGWIAVRSRRLELASNMHARIPKASVMTQSLIEVAVWAAVGGLVVSAALISVSRLDNPDPSAVTLLTGMRTLGSACAGTLVGTLLGASTVREVHLVRYFRDR